MSRSRVLLCIAVTLLLGLLAARADAVLPTMATYGEGTAYEPRFRTWDAFSWSPEQLAIPVGGEIRWCELTSCPARREYMLGILDAGGHLSMQIYTEGIWRDFVELTTAIGPAYSAYRGFDIEYEQLSGRAIAVYQENVPDPTYRIWDGASWSGPQTIDLPTSGAPLWIELASDPYSNSIALVTLDNTNQVGAALWNGTAWVDTCMLISDAFSSEEKGIDVSFFGQSGNVLFAYCGLTKNNFSYTVHTTAGWGTQTDAPNAGNKIRQVRFATNPGTDSLIAAYVDDDSKGRANIWNGSSFGPTTTFESNGVSSKFNQSFDVAWEHSMDQAMIAWSEATRWTGIFDSPETEIYSMAEYNGQLYAGTGNNGRIYVYNGTDWNISVDYTDKKILSLCEYNGKLYAGASDNGIVYVFDGSFWSVSYDSPEKEVQSLAVCDGKLYAGTGNINGIIYVFNGIAWSVAYDSPEKSIGCLAVYDGRLYAGSSDLGRVYVYDGLSWAQSYDSPETSIPTLQPYEGKLYAGGSPDGIIFVYDGVTWAVAYDTPEQDIVCSSVYDTRLYFGSLPDGLILSYDGSAWQTAFDSPETGISSFVTYDSRHYAGSAGSAIIYLFSGQVTQVKYSTLRNGTWSPKMTGPDLAGQTWLVSLTPCPSHDRILLEAATNDSNLSISLWTGNGWDGTDSVESSLPTTSTMPMAVCFMIGPAPSPLLQSPADGYWTTDRSPTFQWEAPDHGDIKYYRIALSVDSMFSPPFEILDSTSATVYTPSVDLADGEYYWRVAAVDSMLKTGDVSETWMFGIDTSPPSKPDGLTADGTSPSPWKNTPSFSIDVDYPDDPTGISLNYYKLRTRPQGLDDTSGTSATKPFDVQAGIEGGESLFVWLGDGMGNRDYRNWEIVLLRYDSQPPEGAYAESPALSHSKLFPVDWTQGWDAGGSGLTGEYTVKVKDGGSPWAFWLNGYQGLSDSFNGVAGHIYYFEAAAIDSAGNIEQFSGTPECSTFIDTVRPYIISTAPANGDTGVDVGIHPLAVFSEEMNVATLNSTNITISGGISGNHTFNQVYSGDTLTLAPIMPFSPGEWCTLAVKKEVEDLAGNSMISDNITTFKVVVPLDTLGPRTDSVASDPQQPHEGTTSITVTAVVSDSMTGRSLVKAAQLFTDSTHGFPVYMNPSDGFFDSSTERVTASVDIEGWKAGETHAIYVRGRDAEFNWGGFDSTLVNVVSKDDTIPPSIAITFPSSGDTSVPTNTWIYVVFSERIDPATLTKDKIAVEASQSGPHNFWMSYNSNDSTLSVNPQIDFYSGESVDVFIASGIKDLGGNPMPSAYSFWFKTGKSADTIAPWVDPFNIAPDTVFPGLIFAISATVHDDRIVSQAEYFIDSTGNPGQGFQMTALDSFGVDSVVSVLDSVTADSFEYGIHWFYVHGKDNSGNWGTFDSASVLVRERDTIGPAFTITVTPEPIMLGDTAWVVVKPNKLLAGVPACTLWDAGTNSLPVSLTRIDSTYEGTLVAVGLKTGTGVMQATGTDMFGNIGKSDTTCSIAAGQEFLPTRLVYAYPNPAPTDEYGDYVYFRYCVASNAEVTIEIYNVEGKLMARLEGDGKGGSKENEIVWSISSIASQFLFYRFSAISTETGERRTVMKKLAIIR